jgi:hypothetical protein
MPLIRGLFGRFAYGLERVPEKRVLRQAQDEAGFRLERATKQDSRAGLPTRISGNRLLAPNVAIRKISLDLNSGKYHNFIRVSKIEFDTIAPLGRA